MAKINLLPVELSPSKGSSKLALIIKKITFYAGGIFLLGALAAIALIFFLTSQLKTSLAKEDSLKQNIASLQKTEQQLFIIKDRISKIKQAESGSLADASFVKVDSILSNLPPNLSVNSIEIDSTKTKFSVLSKDSLGMASFLNNLINSGVFKNLTLNNFTFMPDQGYLVILTGS